MLDVLKSMFKDGLEYTHTAGVLQQIANLVNIVNVQYTKDSDAKNAAIDIVCHILQTHKDVIPAPVPEAVSPSCPDCVPCHAPEAGQNAAE